MPSASTEMTVKLAQDFAAVGKALEGWQKYLKAADSPPSEAGIKKVQAAYDKIKPQIVKFAAGIKAKPPQFPDESDYKPRRKEVTAMTALAGKVDKMVKKEISEAKNEVTVQCVAAAKSELVGKDKKLAQALMMVARGDKGRSGPKEADIKEYNHIHIGGNAKYNLLFQPAKKLVLGTLNFHLDSSNSKSEKENIKKIAKRSGGAVTLKINGDMVAEKK